MNSEAHIAPVPLEKAHRLINHGPVVMVSARHAGVENAMSAAWACALDFSPPKISVVLDKAAFTRSLIEQSGQFALQVPVAAQAAAVLALGHRSRRHQPNKLEQAGVELFTLPEFCDVPLVRGCAAWLACRLIAEPHNQNTYDLFIAQVVAAWADTRVFRNGHWEFESAPDTLRTLHYVAGQQFYATGPSVKP